MTERAKRQLLAVIAASTFSMIAGSMFRVAIEPFGEREAALVIAGVCIGSCATTIQWLLWPKGGIAR